MIQIGDMIKLINTSCKCEFCYEARQDYHEVINVAGNYMRVKLSNTEVDFRKDWMYDVQNKVQENE